MVREHTKQLARLHLRSKVHFQFLDLVHDVGRGSGRWDGHRRPRRRHRGRRDDVHRGDERARRHLRNLVEAQAPGQQILPIALAGGLEAAQLLFDFDDPHLRNPAFADLGEPLPLLLLDLDVPRDLEELRLRVVDVLAHEPQGEETITRPDGVARERMDLRHDTHGRRSDSSVRQTRSIHDLARHDDRPPVGGEFRGPRDQLEVLPSLRTQLEHLGLGDRLFRAGRSSRGRDGRRLEQGHPQIPIPRRSRDHAADDDEQEQCANEPDEGFEHGTLGRYEVRRITQQTGCHRRTCDGPKRAVVISHGADRLRAGAPEEGLAIKREARAARACGSWERHRRAVEHVEAAAGEPVP